jgi:hypothetical protein
VFVAEIDDVGRFAGPAQLRSWAGLTPRHRESDTHINRGHIHQTGLAAGALAAVEAVGRQRGATPLPSCITVSLTAEDGVSVGSQQPASFSVSSTTACATARSVA